MNRKVRHLATRCILSAKAQDGKITVVDALTFVEPNTKALQGVLAALGVTSSALVVDKAPSQPLVRSARNLPKIRTLPARQLNAADLLKAERLVISKEALQEAEALWAAERDRRKLPEGA
jgi:large subunit ribosomal protein L4